MITNWHERFALSTASLDNRTRNVEYVELALATINPLQPSLAPAMKPLFKLHAYLFILERLTKHAFQHGTFIGYHTDAAITEVQEEMTILFENGSAMTEAADPELWQYLFETLSYLRQQMLTHSGAQFYFTMPYILLWKNVIRPYRHDSSLYIEELEHLHAAQEALGDSLSRYNWLLAESKMNFYLSRDQQALEYVTELSKNKSFKPVHLLQFFYDLSDAEEWQRLLDWLTQTASLLERQRSETLGMYFRCWNEAAQHLPSAEQHMWDLLISMLPYSRSIYEDMLLQNGHWKQWIDYQLSTGREPLDYRVTVLAPIEKNAPEALLPFYHQSVEKYVLLKNRSGYKTAAKLLKRLAKLYKKLKNDEQWDVFITAFASRHSRLRALQEELRKGKLIP
ncbi:hypothetical protein FHS15_003414 [Paenibacillus castaneae]|uniref:hypothetical protein n=1 Tax=Paenibacillus castaneae TaxID=474957 RepID=UPI000C9B8452|nr:hypothetical protein [Paenibacillus castaneae]NIK78276.1 hypothetical protein [Paenibacillus castaneae]